MNKQHPKQTRPLAKVAGVAGWPVHHSLSPLIHNYWLQSLKISGAYTMFAVRPDEAVRAFQTLPKTTISGLNVTIPLKGKAFEAADEVSEDALKLGVCNCLYVKDGQLIGHNTDMEGFADPLLRRMNHRYLLNNSAVILGAGGAARAVLGALLSIGVPEITLLNRTDAKAEKLVHNINIPNLFYVPWADRHKAVMGAGLVVNASAAGMKGGGDLDIELDNLTTGAWVYDLVYTPEHTSLLVRAQARGLNTIGGLEMLVAQARPSFKLFFGQTPPPTPELMEKLRAQLAR